MLYIDNIYGKVEITEPLLLDLISSDAMQRIKGIAQHGITALLGITPPFTRFDHCVGTMLLVRSLGADIREQVGALLHDISHTAFSHVIDFVFDDHNGQSYHEKKKIEFVSSTDIPTIMHRHNLDWRQFMDEDQFSLLEQPSPALCADRLDYFFRDLEYLKLANRAEIRNALKALQVTDERIVVNNIDVARWLAYTFIETDRASWSSFREVGLYQLTAEAIKAANKFGLITEDDLWGSDEALWQKLTSADHSEVRQWLEMITPGTRFIWDDASPLFRIATKIRSINPLVSTNNAVKVLSELDETFRQYRKEYMSEKQGLWPMSVISAFAGQVYTNAL